MIASVHLGSASVVSLFPLWAHSNNTAVSVVPAFFLETISSFSSTAVGKAKSIGVTNSTLYSYVYHWLGSVVFCVKPCRDHCLVCRLAEALRIDTDRTYIRSVYSSRGAQCTTGSLIRRDPPTPPRIRFPGNQRNRAVVLMSVSKRLFFSTMNVARVSSVSASYYWCYCCLLDCFLPDCVHWYSLLHVFSLVD